MFFFNLSNLSIELLSHKWSNILYFWIAVCSLNAVWKEDCSLQIYPNINLPEVERVYHKIGRFRNNFSTPIPVNETALLLFCRVYLKFSSVKNFMITEWKYIWKSLYEDLTANSDLVSESHFFRFNNLICSFPIELFLFGFLFFQFVSFHTCVIIWSIICNEYFPLLTFYFLLLKISTFPVLDV